MQVSDHWGKRGEKWDGICSARCSFVRAWAVSPTWARRGLIVVCEFSVFFYHILSSILRTFGGFWVAFGLYFQGFLVTRSAPGHSQGHFGAQGEKRCQNGGPTPRKYHPKMSTFSILFVKTCVFSMCFGNVFSDQVFYRFLDAPGEP